MSYIIEDSELAKHNQSLVMCGNGPAYNAVLSVLFSGEATTEPFDVAAAKAWLRVDISDDDALITALIKAARIACEKYANQSFIARTVTAKIHNGLGNFTLPYGPVVAISSIKDGETILSDYDVADPYDNDLVIVYTAGYTALPEDIIVAIKNQVAFMYENRGDQQKASGLSELSKLLLNSVRDV